MTHSGPGYHFISRSRSTWLRRNGNRQGTMICNDYVVCNQSSGYPCSQRSVPNHQVHRVTDHETIGTFGCGAARIVLKYPLDWAHCCFTPTRLGFLALCRIWTCAMGQLYTHVLACKIFGSSDALPSLQYRSNGLKIVRDSTAYPQMV